MTGEKFFDFVRGLIPNTLPLGGINPHSIVVLDNCRISCTRSERAVSTRWQPTVNFTTLLSGFESSRGGL